VCFFLHVCVCVFAWSTQACVSYEEEDTCVCVFVCLEHTSMSERNQKTKTMCINSFFFPWLHSHTRTWQFTIEDLRNIKRPVLFSFHCRIIEHVLWSDPSDSDSATNHGVHVRCLIVSWVLVDMIISWCARQAVYIIISL